MNIVGVVLISLMGVLSFMFGGFMLVDYMRPDYGGCGDLLCGLLFALLFSSGSIVCLWGAWQMLLGEEK